MIESSKYVYPLDKSEEIKNVNVFNNDNYFGINIKTDFQTIELKMEKFICCEKYNINFRIEIYNGIIAFEKNISEYTCDELEESLNKCLENATIKQINHSKSVNRYDDLSKEYFGCCEVIITFNSNYKLIVTFSNVHSKGGYYPHEIWFKWHNYEYKDQL